MRKIRIAIGIIFIVFACVACGKEEKKPASSIITNPDYPYGNTIQYQGEDEDNYDTIR